MLIANEALDAVPPANITLRTNSYEDIFSDFDPRPKTAAALSIDFLNECRRASYDKPLKGELELRILVPKKTRRPKEEIKIRQRLHAHFDRHHHLEQLELGKLRKEGFSWFFFGGILIFFALMINDYE